MSLAADELTRLRYLDALGIRSFVSRRAVPGAAPTRRLALRGQPDVTDRASGESVVAPRPAGRAPKALRDMLDTPSAREPSASPSPVEGGSSGDGDGASAAKMAGSGSAARQSSMPGLRFRVAVIVCAGRLWIEDLGDNALAREQLALIGAMGRAMVHPNTCPDPSVGQFDWPLHDNGQFDLGDEEAAASLQGFLARQLDDNQCVELICLGDEASERIKGLALACARRDLPSTQMLLSDPLRKRDAWRALRSE